MNIRKAEPFVDAAAPAASLVVVGTQNRTTGAVVCAASGPPGTAVWVSAERMISKLQNGGFAGCELVILEPARREDLEAAAKSRSGSRPALVAFIPDHRADLRSAAEKLGFDGCLSAPIDVDEAAGLTRALLKPYGRVAAPVDEEQEDEPASSVVDERALRDLASLGGQEFVNDIVSQFIDDATTLLRSLHDAMASGDANAFRDQAHALRSCAANVGASSVYAQCLALRGIEKRELLEQGPGHLERLANEISFARHALQTFVAAR